jgi:hypothetical protein
LRERCSFALARPGWGKGVRVPGIAWAVWCRESRRVDLARFPLGQGSGLGVAESGGYLRVGSLVFWGYGGVVMRKGVGGWPACVPAVTWENEHGAIA